MNSYAEIRQMGFDLVKSGLLPDSIRTGEQAAAIILAGQELGLAAMQSLRSVVLVKGRVTLSAELMLALAARAGIRCQWVETTDLRAEIELTRPGGEAQRIAFTAEDAKRAGLAGDNWRKYPAAMLRARCASAATRAVCPDVLLGVYVHGELDDEPEDAAPKPRKESPAEKKARQDEHHPSWSGDRAGFCARLGEVLPELADAYETVSAWCADVGRPRPSQMDAPTRAKLLAYVSDTGAGGGSERLWGWIKDQPLDAVKLREVTP